MVGSECAGGAVATAWAEDEPGPEGGCGFEGGSGGAADPGVEPGSGVDAGDGDGLEPGGEKGSPLDWSLALYMQSSGPLGSGQRERCWAGHADAPASPTPADTRRRKPSSLPVYCALVCVCVRCGRGSAT